jgi:RNA polymerase sigma-70 factor (ECF subfamily)
LLFDDDPPEQLGAIDDDRLRLIFTCCHLALSPETRIALTLRMVGGLTVPEIARAFLMSRQLRTWGRRRGRTSGTGERVAAAEAVMHAAELRGKFSTAAGKGRTLLAGEFPAYVVRRPGSKGATIRPLPTARDGS